MKIIVGNRRYATLEVTEKDLSFQEFAKQCSKPLKGDKWGFYFIRGCEISKPHRADENLLSAEFLIIDADSSSADDNSAPSPKEGHEKLKQLGYSHFIYTSNSHSKTQNKWRAVIPWFCKEKTTEENKQTLKVTYLQLISDLQKIGLDIAPTRESYVWSQPWYMPTRENPDDGLFEYYEWFDGKSPTAESIQIKKEEIENLAIDDNETVEGIINGLITGKHCHTAVRKLLYMEVKDGVTKEAACAKVSALMQINKTHKDWETVYNNIEKSFDDALKKVDIDFLAEKLDLSDSTTSLGHKLPYETLAPQNLFGDLVRAVFDNSPAPNLMVANMTVRATIAYLACGHYTISGFYDRTNLQQIVIGGTGTGKDSAMRMPKKIITTVYGTDPIGQLLVQGVQSDMASGEGMDDQLRTIANKMNKHDILFCRDEIGKDIKHASKGNAQKIGVFDYLLRAYTLSNDPLVPPRLMSKRGKTTKDGVGLEVHLIHPGVNLIGATVERSLVDGLNIDFVISGTSARLITLPVDDYASDVAMPDGEDGGLVISSAIEKNIKRIISTKGMPAQGNIPNCVKNREDINTRKVELSKQIHDEILEIINKDNRKKGELSGIWNRRGVNAKKMAMCEAILEDPINPIITPEIMKRCMEIATFSCKYLEKMFDLNVGENDFDIAKKKVLDKLKKIITVSGKICIESEKNKGWVARKDLVNIRAVKALGADKERFFNELLLNRDIEKWEKSNVRGKPSVFFRFYDKH